MFIPFIFKEDVERQCTILNSFAWPWCTICAPFALSASLLSRGNNQFFSVSLGYEHTHEHPVQLSAKSFGYVTSVWCRCLVILPNLGLSHRKSLQLKISHYFSLHDIVRALITFHMLLHFPFLVFALQCELLKLGILSRGAVPPGFVHDICSSAERIWAEMLAVWHHKLQ